MAGKKNNNELMDFEILFTNGDIKGITKKYDDFVSLRKNSSPTAGSPTKPLKSLNFKKAMDTNPTFSIDKRGDITVKNGSVVYMKFWKKITKPINESKSIFDYSENSMGYVTITNTKTKKDVYLKNGSDIKSFQKDLKAFEKKFGNKANFDNFVTTFGYDEMLENLDNYKYNSESDTKENKVMSETNKDKDLDLFEETLEDETLEEVLDELVIEDKDDDKDDSSKEKKLTKDDDSDKDEDGDDDGDVKEEYENVSLDDIITEHVDAIKLTVEDISENLESDEELNEEDTKLYSKLADLMEVRLKEFATKIGTEIVTLSEEVVTEYTEGLVDKIDRFGSHVVNEWHEENQVAIEENTVGTIHESILSQVIDVLKENNINVTQEDLDREKELNEKIQSRDDTIANISEDILTLSATIEDMKKEAIVNEFKFKEDTDKETFTTLIEDVEFLNEEDYRNRLQLINKKYITEDVDNDDEPDVEVKTLVEGLTAFDDIDDSLFNTIIEEEKETEIEEHPSKRVRDLMENLGKMTANT